MPELHTKDINPAELPKQITDFVKGIASQYPNSKAMLIPTLIEAQKYYGHVTDEVAMAIGKLLKVPYRLLYPAILLFCCVGIYSLNYSVFDIILTALFGLLGVLLIKLGCEPAPLVLAFVLGPMMEENLRRALTLSRGDATVFVTSPICAGLLATIALILLASAAPRFRRVRREAFADD